MLAIPESAIRNPKSEMQWVRCRSGPAPVCKTGALSRIGGFDSHLTHCLAMWWNWQTHGVQNAAPHRHGSSTLPVAT